MLDLSTQSVQPPAKRGPGGQKGLKQAYTFRDLAATMCDELKNQLPDDLKARTSVAGALRDLFAVWDGARQAIRIYKGLGNPKPVEARNSRGKRKRNGVTGTAPPPPMETI